MPEYDENWFAQKGEYAFEVTPRHMVDIRVSCSKTVQVLGVPEESGKAAVVLKTGEEFRFRGPVYGFKKIAVRGTGQTPFGCRIIHSPRQDGEVISDEKPAVLVLPEPSNLVAKMRRMSADHHRFNRMPVLEPEDGPSFGRYEVDDDQDLLFEEEAFAKYQADQKKAKEEADAKARKDAEAEAEKLAQERDELDPPQHQEPPPKAAE